MLFLKRSFRVPSKSTFIQIIITGIIVGLHWITFFKAVQLSTASFGVLCLSTTTLHVAWIEPIVMKRPFSWLEIALGLIVIFGIYFVSQDFSGNQFLALLYGLASALFAALFAVFNAKFVETTAPSTISFYEMMFATLSITILLVVNGDFNTSLFEMRFMDLIWLIVLGTICTSLAFLLIIDVVKYLGAFTVSLSINLEPVYTMILGILIFNENQELNTRFYLGSVLIIGVIFFNAILKSKLKKRNALRESIKS
jgi:drug/metabolite transporter (DMT)-like permease